MASTAARIAKDKGNAAFKAGQWADAVGHYSAALVADRTEPTYPLNRAAAYLKLGKHRDAERDATTVLSLDANNVKAFFRRAQARVALGSLSEAATDLTDALRLDPANDAIKAELTTVQKKRKAEAARKQASTKREPITVPSSQPKSPPKAEAPRHGITRNVPIEIIEPESSVPPSTEFLNPVQSHVLSPSTPPNPTPKSKPRVGAAIFRADGNHTILRDPTSDAPPAPAPAPPPASKAAPVSPPSNATAATPVSKAPPAPNSKTSVPPPPLTLFAFSRAWHALRTPQERFDLLCRIPPESLPALFQNSLEPELLISILRVFTALASPSLPTIAAYMSALPAVPRFATVLLFLSAKERDVVRAVWDRVGGDSERRRAWGA